MRIRIASIVIALLVLAGAAHAQSDGLKMAREYFDKAQTLFEAGNYAQAAEFFEKAYEARNFPQFLFNIGVCYEKQQKWQQAIDYYNRYLAENPDAADAKALRERMEVLKRELARVEEAAKQPPPDPNTDPNTDPNADPNATPTPPPPSEEVTNLSKVSLRGLVVIESTPPGATIYLDTKKSKPFARTPWSGTLKGEHKIFIESKGYKPIEKDIYSAPDRLATYDFTLAEEDYLGWLEIKSNVPGADIYIDDKASGVYQRTPYAGNIKPGKHKIWVTKDGYEEFYQEIEIVRGQTHEVTASMKGSPVGYVSIEGEGVEFATIYLDGQVLCERGPCRKPVNEGTHTIEFKRADHKPYKRTVVVQQKTETTLSAKLQEDPGRADAITAYVVGAAFIGFGIYSGLKANSIEDEIQDQLANGPPLASSDARLGWGAFEGGKFWATTADVAYGIGGLALITAVYYTFRDKGPPSTGESSVKAIALEPTLSPSYSGLALGGRF